MTKVSSSANLSSRKSGNRCCCWISGDVKIPGVKNCHSTARYTLLHGIHPFGVLQQVSVAVGVLLSMCVSAAQRCIFWWLVSPFGTSRCFCRRYRESRFGSSLSYLVEVAASKYFRL